MEKMEMVKEFYTSEADRWVGITKSYSEQKAQEVESLIKSFVQQNKELVFFGSIATAMVAAMVVLFYFWLPILMGGIVLTLIKVNQNELMQSLGSFTSDVVESATTQTYNLIWGLTIKATKKISPYGNVDADWTEVGESIQKVEQATQVEKAENPNLVEVDEADRAMEEYFQENLRDSINYEVF